MVWPVSAEGMCHLMIDSTFVTVTRVVTQMPITALFSPVAEDQQLTVWEAP